jgi:hypothetical protein
MRLSKIQHPFLGPPEVRGLLLARGVTGWFGVAFSIYHSLGYLTYVRCPACPLHASCELTSLLLLVFVSVGPVSSL